MKIITIDFDCTLAEHKWVGEKTELIPIDKVVRFVRQKAEEGYIVHIVTYRHTRDLEEVEKFVKTHKLPIASIVPTSMRSKGPFIKALGAELHVDDDIYALISAEEHGVSGLLVTSRFDLPNTAADLFEKI